MEKKFSEWLAENYGKTATKSLKSSQKCFESLSADEDLNDMCLMELMEHMANMAENNGSPIASRRSNWQRASVAAIFPSCLVIRILPSCAIRSISPSADIIKTKWCDTRSLSVSLLRFRQTKM